MRKLFLLTLLFAAWRSAVSHSAATSAQTEGAADAPSAEVRAALERWQDWKFGLMLHWGPYSQWGAVESWTLCSEDEPWCRRPIEDYAEYKRRYEELPRTFAPRRFDPDAWAEAAERAGMRYLVFTTKHHDGFCMWDTRTTDYRITGPSCAFADDPRADVTRALFDAFRARGFGIGAYFSKPDWHSNDYWWRNFATPDRNVNYSIERYPERWERFVRFTHSQVLELVQGYGPLDVLWLDGGWVRPRDTITPDVAAWCKSPEDQDVDMPALAAAARRIRPGLLIVDRTVHGPFEDYRTPEQEVPDGPLPHPWETCMTIATQWSYKEDDRTKSARQLVHTLVRVVAAGGNFLLNVGPSPEGELPPEALERLAEVGAWLDVCGEAIYGTRPATPWRDGEVYLTRRAEGAWALVPLAAGTPPPSDVRWRGLVPRAGSAVRLLGHAEALGWDVQDGTTVVRLPEEARAALADALALALAFTPEGG